MVRTEIRYVVDMTMLIVFIISAITGFVLWYEFPSGSGRGQSMFLSLSKHDWIRIHDYSNVILTAMIIIHFVINVNWIIKTTKNLFGKDDVAS